MLCVLFMPFYWTLWSYINIVQNSLVQRIVFNFTVFWNCRSNNENQYYNIATSSSTDVHSANNCSASFPSLKWSADTCLTEAEQKTPLVEQPTASSNLWDNCTGGNCYCVIIIVDNDKVQIMIKVLNSLRRGRTTDIVII